MARPRLYDWDEIKRLHDGGMSPYQIARQLGCTYQTVHYALAPDDPEYRRAMVREWRAKRKASRPLKDVVTKQDVIHALIEFVGWVGRPPKKKEWGTEGLPSAHIAANLFGTHRAAIEAAGFDSTPLPSTAGGSKPHPKPGPTCTTPGCAKKVFRDYVDYTQNISESLCREHWFEMVRKFAPSP